MHSKNYRIVIGHNLDKIYGIYPEEETFRYAKREELRTLVQASFR